MIHSSQEFMTDSHLSSEEVLRYSRHLTLPDFGIEGQIKLKQASVLAVGAGGLGSPLLSYLAAAGVGRIGIVDFDIVEAHVEEETSVTDV